MAAVISFSEVRRFRVRGATVLFPVVAALGVAAAVGAGAHSSPDPRFDGEYGLYVHFTADSLITQWLTAEPAAGVMEVSWPAGPPQRVTTPPGRAHRASFVRPRHHDAVLRYGPGNAAAGVTHETRVSLASPRRPPVEIRGVDSLYVVGDTHGEFDALITGLRSAGLIGEALEWTGGRKHLAFAGDLTDRGPDVVRLLWFVYRLEQEAARAGGRVHVVLGNHETMVMMGDLRYVHPKESEIAGLHGVGYDRMLDIRHSVLGRWLASKPALIRVDRALIAHGGVAPEFAELSLRGFDQILARFMAEDLFYRWAELEDSVDLPGFDARHDFFWHPRSVFWHRAYVQSDTAGAELGEVLRRLGADVLVVGHTAVRSIQARYDGRLIAAHTPRYGAELLLLVRSGGRYERFRITPDAPPEPF